MPKITVIIPTFNRVHLLPRAVESVLHQTYSDWELIIVDDGSFDYTPQYLQQLQKQYPDVIKILSHEKNLGVSAARMTGVALAQGNYLAFLDSDDQWLPHKLNRQMQILEENPTYLAVHSQEIWIRNGVRVNQMKKHQKGAGDQFLPSLHRCVVSPSSIVIDRSCFLNLGGFRVQYNVCEDYDLWLRFFSQFEILYIEEALLVKYGGHEDQLSRSQALMDKIRIEILYSLFKELRLTDEKRQQLVSVLHEKCRILEIGAKKHRNQAICDFIQHVLLEISNTSHL